MLKGGNKYLYFNCTIFVCAWKVVILRRIF